LCIRSEGEGYLQELQDDDEQLEHPDDVDRSTPLIPKTENFFVTFGESQLGQETCRLPKTSFSKLWPQESHRYSKIGIFDLVFPEKSISQGCIIAQNLLIY